MVQAPRRTTMLAVDRSHAWGTQLQSNTDRFMNSGAVRFIRRYRIVER
jgi:hypothetical protein